MAEDTIIHLKLNDAKKERIREKIDNEMSKIYEKRQEMGFKKQVQRNKDYYEGIMDPNHWGPWEGSAKYFMQMISTHVDIVSIKALRQSVGIHPMIQQEADENFERPEDLRDREDRLDYILRNDIDIERMLKTGVYREACIQGASFVKVCHTNQVENIKYKETYTPDQIEEYKRDSWRKFDHSPDKRISNIQELQNGNEITVTIDEERTKYYGPNAYRVDIEDLFLRPDIKEMDRHRLIAERLNYTWKDIQEKLDVDYFREDGIKKIKEKNEDDYFMKDYTLYECILYAKLGDKFRKYVITYEPDSKAILRAIHYPYRHGQIYYIPYYIKEKDDSVYGYSLVDMLADANDYINDIMNGMLDRIALDNNPVLRVPENSDLMSYDWGPNSWLPSDKPVEILSAKKRSIDETKVLGLMKSFSETVDGVNAQVLSGGVPPGDPKGPAAKQAMQTETSNFRIEDYIINLQYGNAVLAEQVEKLKEQYPAEDDENNVDPEVMAEEVRYRPHGTSLGINKGQNIATLKDLINTLGVLAPEIIKDPKKRKLLLKLYLNNIGGILEKKKNEILPEQIQPLAQQTGQMDMKESMRGAFENLTPEEQEAIKADVSKIQEGQE